jgi:Spy/CpxP family protein refolding chaperone
MLRNGVLIAAATILISGVGLGQQGPGPAQGRPQAGEGGRQRVMRFRTEAGEKLNLSDEQKKSIQKLRLEMEKKNIPLHSQIQLARLEIKEQMTAEKPDRAKIEKSMKQVSELEFQLKVNRLDHLFAVRNLLTPEQLKSWHGMGGMSPQIQRRLRIFRQGGEAMNQREGIEESPEMGNLMWIDESNDFDEPQGMEENVIIERE